MTNKIKHLILILIFIFFCICITAQTTRKDPVDFRKMAKFLSDINGFNATGKAEGQNISMGEFKASEATRNYESGKKKLEIKIADYTYYPMMKQGMEMMMNFEIDSSDKYVKKIDIEGYTGVIEYEYEDEEARLILFLKNSILIIIELRPTKDRKEILEITKSLDLKGLSAL